MLRYEAIYLEKLDKLVLYHNGSIVFEGSKNDVDECINKLTDLYKVDLNKLVDEADYVYDVLTKLKGEN